MLESADLGDDTSERSVRADKDDEKEMLMPSSSATRKRLPSAPAASPARAFCFSSLLGVRAHANLEPEAAKRGEFPRGREKG